MKQAVPAPTCGCRDPPEGTRGRSPTQGFPSPGFQSWAEKEFPQNLTVKFSGDSSRLGEKEGN